MAKPPKVSIQGGYKPKGVSGDGIVKAPVRPEAGMKIPKMPMPGKPAK